MERIVINPKIMHGKPVIEGTRVPVDVILDALAAGMAHEEICKEYGVTEQDIRAAIKYAAEIVSHETVKPLKVLE